MTKGIFSESPFGQIELEKKGHNKVSEEYLEGFPIYQQVFNRDVIVQHYPETQF